MTRGGQTLNFAVDGRKLVLKSPADHPKLDDYKLDECERGLELLTFQDVKTGRGSVKATRSAGESVFATK